MLKLWLEKVKYRLTGKIPNRGADMTEEDRIDQLRRLIKPTVFHSGETVNKDANS